METISKCSELELPNSIAECEAQAEVQIENAELNAESVTEEAETQSCIVRENLTASQPNLTLTRRYPKRNRSELDWSKDKCKLLNIRVTEDEANDDLKK